MMPVNMMPAPLEYLVISSWDRIIMSADVNKHLCLGWQLSGGVSVSHSENSKGYKTYMYVQAMILPRKEPVIELPIEQYKMSYLNAAGEKCYYPVEQCPGIGAKTQALMARYKIRYLYELVGQFMCLERNPVLFDDWLQLNFKTLSAKDRARCTEYMVAYGEQQL